VELFDHSGAAIWRSTVVSRGDPADDEPRRRVWLHELTGSDEPGVSASPGVIAVDFDASGDVLALAMQAGTLHVWDTTTGTSKRSWPAYGAPTSAALRAGASAFAYGGVEGALLGLADRPLLRITDAHPPLPRDRSQLRRLSGSALPTATGLSPLAISRDGAWLVAPTPQAKIAVWDAHTARVKTSVDLLDRGVLALAFSPDGGAVYAATEDHAIVRWDLASATVRVVLEGIAPGARALAVSRDGASLAVSAHEAVTVHDLTARTPPVPLVGHVSIVRDIAFRDDGAVIATASGSGGVRLWSRADGRLLAWARPTLHMRGVWVEAPSDDGVRFDWAGDAARFLVCRAGARPVALEACEAKNGVPGLLRRLLEGKSLDAP